MELAGYPAVVAVVAGRFPLLFSVLARFEQDLGVAHAEPMSVAGVAWDVWCRSMWLANACAVEDIGYRALATLASLPQLLRSMEKDGNDTVNEVWSVLHVLSWAVRCSAIGGSVATLLESCEEFWLLVRSEVATAGRHIGVQLVLLDLLSALALHVAFSTPLHRRLVALVAELTQLPLPVHFHTAVRLYYGCAVVEQEDEGAAMEKAHEQLRDAWARLTQQSALIPPALQAAEWIVGEEVKQSLETARQLHRLLRSSCSGTAPDVKAITAFRKKACELPAVLRAFCVHALPGNPLLWLHRALANSSKAHLVAAITDTLADVVVDAAPESEAAETTGAGHAHVGNNAYAQLFLQQLWVSGMSVSLSALLNRRDSAITAAVMRLLQWIAIRTPHEGSMRRVLLGAPSMSLIVDVLAGIAKSDAVKGELKKKAVRAVVEHAFCLVCALDHAELTSVFNDSLLMSTRTLISEGKDDPTLLDHGLRALVHLAAAFPMAASMALDFDFLAEQCAIADSPAVSVGALIVGSLNVMSAIVVQQPAVVTFEWIEALLGILQNLDGWRHSVPDLDVTLWRCVRHTIEASEDCNEYLFTEETHRVLRNELESMKCEGARLHDIMPSLLTIAAHIQPFEHPRLSATTYEAIKRVPVAQWTEDICDGALRFLVASCPSLDSDKADEATARHAVTAAAAVLYGAELSNVRLPASAWDDFARGLSEKGLATDAVTELFDLAHTAASALSASGADMAASEATKLRSSILPLLRNLFATCPTVRSPAAAERAQDLCSILAGDLSSACTPQLLQAALLLVEDTCASSIHAGTTPESIEMRQVWTCLTNIAHQAVGKEEDEAWRTVLSRVYAAAHTLILTSSVVPIVSECDPRVDFVGKCVLLHVSIAECAALLQTVLNYDDARASLRRDYGESYSAALQRIADPTHYASGLVPLSLQQYLGEVTQR
ncbi:conserved hypothetical protein [Leishmania mexicana MHOM/GT/2001/U1103]|uniref:Uncharacterized protein n=1 Tax=Leishmania mexicana (strain MHOM/GT/2001/U1103) TaxID=929439 RepID=E9B4F1_LEIMU|nr:conserved hypothetical protein [Leishmania mexicana MHOM/GT/2001/U1103]CBZ30120.1 conserved hypothetical protein [Leishmania mexicana MHOM/GT/2001/U1103]